MAERVRLRIGNLSKAVLVTGQAYQDPKDALNEFVSNAADEYAEAGIRGGRIRVILHRRGRCSNRRRPATRGRWGRRRSGCWRSPAEGPSGGEPPTIDELTTPRPPSQPPATCGAGPGRPEGSRR